MLMQYGERIFFAVKNKKISTYVKCVDFSLLMK